MNYIYKQLPLLSSDYYSQMVWDLSKHPFYIQSQQDKQEDWVYKIFFEKANNPYIMQELQACFSGILEEKKFAWPYVLRMVRSIHHIIEYMNTKHGINSILDIPRETILYEYPTFLQTKGIKAYIFATCFTPLEGYKKVNDRYKVPEFSYILRYYDFIYEHNYVKDLPLLEKDIWYVKDLSFEVNGFTDHSPRHTLNFSKIPQPEIRLLAKKYALIRLRMKVCVTTVRNDIIAIAQFARFLKTFFPEINTLAILTRDHVERYFEFIESSKLKDITKDKRKGKIRKFLIDLYERGISGGPKRKLISKREILGRHRENPESFSDDELGVLTPYLPLLPLNIQRMFKVLSAVGMRINELCCLKISDFYEKGDGACFLKYYQRKTKYYNNCDLRTADMDEARHALKEAIEDSRKLFGPDSIYIFPSPKNTPFQQNRFTDAILKLVHKHRIEVDGELLVFKSHKCRKTKVSKALKAGKSLKEAADDIGMKHERNLKHYNSRPKDFEVHDNLRLMHEIDDRIIDDVVENDDFPV